MNFTKKGSFIRKYRSGISLIEMSFIIIIAAALAVVSIRGFSVNLDNAFAASVHNNLTNYESEMYIFTTTHSALPGDFAEASITLPHTADCEKSPTSVGTIDGNGDNQINFHKESVKVWCHMYLNGQGIKRATFNIADITTVPTNFKVDRNLPNAGHGTLAALPLYLEEPSANISGNVIMVADEIISASIATNKITRATKIANIGMEARRIYHLKTKYDPGNEGGHNKGRYRTTKMVIASDSENHTSECMDQDSKINCIVYLTLNIKTPEAES